MLFDKYRINRLTQKVKLQRAKMGILSGYAKDSGNSYYADRHIDAFIILNELQEKLNFLEQRQAN